jgi:hypothetical protein
VRALPSVMRIEASCVPSSRCNIHNRAGYTGRSIAVHGHEVERKWRFRALSAPGATISEAGPLCRFGAIAVGRRVAKPPKVELSFDGMMIAR